MPCTCSCRFRGTAADSTRSSVATASRAIIDYCNRTGRDIKIYFATYTGLTVGSKETQKSYYVQKGDSLFSIAKKHPGVTISDLKQWNGIGSNGNIKPGMKLKIQG